MVYYAMPRKKKDPKQLWKEGVLEANQERHAKEQAEIRAGYDDSDQAEATELNSLTTKELNDEWEHLRRIAIAEFPEGADQFGLSPKNRLVAIAHCLGWANAKIAKASKLNPSTVSRWLSKRPDIKLFINEFQMRRGETDVVKDKFSALEYKATKCVEAILDDKDDSVAMKRLKSDVSKWVFERTRGKPSQPIEHKGEAVKQMLETMRKVGEFSLSEEEEKELFEDTLH